jgi:hypothetical protein
MSAEDEKYIHPSIGNCVRLPIVHVDDAYLQTKWAASKTYPKEVYLRPDYPLSDRQRDVFRNCALLLTKKSPFVGPLLRQLLRAEITPDEFLNALKKLKYEKKTRVKKPTPTTASAQHAMEKLVVS